MPYHAARSNCESHISGTRDIQFTGSTIGSIATDVPDGGHPIALVIITVVGTHPAPQNGPYAGDVVKWVV